MSIKIDQIDQLDSQQGLNLQFNGNELIAIGEQEIQNDFDQQDLEQILSLEDEIRQIYDITINESSPINMGPCLYRSDYECDPPKTWSRYRREIGYISFDASLESPIYYFDKSYKRFVHIPKDREKCSYNVYQGYSEFIEKIRLNPENYFRPYDSTDLRHLLNWYTEKQCLFSLTNPNLLKPPTFICRRTVLRTILANLYYDSEPWKLLVLRIKGQFYLALANKASKKSEDMTEDEYSGYHFEQLFTTKQPNTTRFKENIPLENPQQGFHTVQYWQFGKFNILYSNEIDGEIIAPPKTEEIIKPTTTTEEEIPSEDNIEDESKQAQINENLQITTNDENEKIEKKKRNEFELKSGYVEMKCTNKKIFYRDENKLHTLHWWAQMWLANVNTLMIGYKTTNDGLIDQIDLFSIEQFISKFYSRYNLYLKYCFSYLYSFLQLIENTVHIDDTNTIHVFTYIPQPLEIDPLTGKTLQMDLPKSVPFRYTQIKRSNQRHANFMPQNYLNYIQRTILNEQDKQIKTIEQETKKRIGHRGRSNCILKQKS
jgi:hypothetical protein